VIPASACPVCRSPRLRTDFRLEGLTVTACRRCGHRFLDPPPPPEEIDRLFSALYAGDKGVIDRYFPEWKEFYLRPGEAAPCPGCRRLLDRRLDLLSRYRTPGRLLDVGCGFGEFAGAARRRGWEVVGVEPSRPAAERAAADFGFEVFSDLADPRLARRERYDVVTLWDVLEHQVDPAGFLGEVMALLVTGGVLALTVPNRACLIVSLARLIHRLTGGRAAGPLGKFYVITHLQYSDRTGLATILAATGCRILSSDGEDTCLDHLDLSPAAKRSVGALFALMRLSGNRNRILLYAKKV